MSSCPADEEILDSYEELEDGMMLDNIGPDQEDEGVFCIGMGGAEVIALILCVILGCLAIWMLANYTVGCVKRLIGYEEQGYDEEYEYTEDEDEDPLVRSII